MKLQENKINERKRLNYIDPYRKIWEDWRQRVRVSGQTTSNWFQVFSIVLLSRRWIITFVSMNIEGNLKNLPAPNEPSAHHEKSKKKWKWCTSRNLKGRSLRTWLELSDSPFFLQFCSYNFKKAWKCVIVSVSVSVAGEQALLGFFPHCGAYSQAMVSEKCVATPWFSFRIPSAHAKIFLFRIDINCAKISSY